MKIFIVYYEVFVQNDYPNPEISVGGIQTYLYNLAKTLSSHYSTTIIQFGKNTNSINHEQFEINFLKSNNKFQSGKELFSLIKNNIQEKDLIIWGTDSIALKTKYKSILIQHGVAFDYYPIEKKIPKLLKNIKLDILYRVFQQKRSIGFFEKSKYKVCVDYNYLNWYRINSVSSTKNIFVIPNFSLCIDNFKLKENKTIKIIFARRFVPKRGVLILIEIINSILKKYNNVEFGIYGDGPMKSKLINEFSQNSKVTIEKFSSVDSLSVHSNFDIALVPTIGSEGTSFSLLEAMGSGCACICSNVGGMTNIIIDNYNGYLVNPDTESFCKKIELLLNDKFLRNEIRKNAYFTVEQGFSKKIWEKRWLDIILALQH
jgi:glycosyltransferase involved in cell wall biosynthesis